MSKITMVFGLLLCCLTIVVLAIRWDAKSPTIYIPMGFGIPLILLGAAAEFKPTARKHFMHAAVAIGLIGAIAALSRGVPKLIQLIQGIKPDPEKPFDTLAFSMVMAMATLCTIFVVLCIKSFIAARKARNLESKA